MKLLHKLQQWPERKKKILLFTIVAIFGILLFKSYINNLQKTFQSFNGEKIKRELQINLKGELLKTKKEAEKLEEELKKFYENIQKNEQGKSE